MNGSHSKPNGYFTIEWRMGDDGDPMSYGPVRVVGGQAVLTNKWEHYPVQITELILNAVGTSIIRPMIASRDADPARFAELMTMEVAEAVIACEKTRLMCDLLPNRSIEFRLVEHSWRLEWTANPLETST